MKTVDSIRDLIGNTPLLRCVNLEKSHSAQAKVFAKLEMMNPGGSVKDRIAWRMIQKGMESGAIGSETVIIEPTSGNTGIGLASVGASLGLKVILVMPDTMSVERRNLLKAYGAELVLTPGKDGMKGAIAKALSLKESYKDAFIPSQFENKENPSVHYETTGPELWEQTKGKVDILVAGVGTGGTITGVGQYLREKNPDLNIVAVEPSTSRVLQGFEPGPHKIQGIGAGFIPDVLEMSLIDHVISVDDEHAFEYARLAAIKEGILIGISAGAALYAALTLAKDPENQDKNIVVIFPDTGERYMSMHVFDEESL